MHIACGKNAFLAGSMGIYRCFYPSSPIDGYTEGFGYRWLTAYETGRNQSQLTIYPIFAACKRFHFGAACFFIQHWL